MQQHKGKALHIITSLGDGGAEAMLAAVCLNTPSIQHTVVSLRGGGINADRLRQSGIEVHTLNLRPHLSSIKGVLQLLKVLRLRWDVVHTWMYHANLLGGVLARAFWQRRVVWSVHHGKLGRKSKWSTRLVNQCSAWLSYVVPDAMVAVSSHVTDVHVDYGYKDAFTVINNGCDIARFIPGRNDSLRRELGILSSGFVIGCVARFSPEKGHDIVISGLEGILTDRQDVYVVFVGQGCTRENPQFVSALGALAAYRNVICLGTRSDVPDVMRLLDLHVLASREEAFGNVTVEAMASGVPCIVTRTGAAEHIVADTGWTVPPEEGPILHAAVLDAFEEWRDTPLWIDRQQRSRCRVVDEFSMDTCARRYEELWSKCIP